MVTFETKCYENDYQYILQGDRLRHMIEGCNFAFAKRQVIINNVANRKKVAALAEEKKSEGIIDQYYFVEDYAEKCLDHFGLTKESFRGGYYYSIAELVGIFVCQTDFLLHFSSDACINPNSNTTWISEAVALLTTNPLYGSANPCWDSTFKGGRDEAIAELDHWFVSYGFSDQSYLIPTRLFKGNIYSDKNVASNRYPGYGGELFEKKVDAYMRNHHLQRLTSKEVSYTHHNFPTKTTLQFRRRLQKNIIDRGGRIFSTVRGHMAGKK